MDDKFIDHFYVIEDLSASGPLKIKECTSLEEAIAAYKQLPDDKLKTLGAQNTLPQPGSIDLVHCIRGNDYVVQDYKDVLIWDRPEIHKIVERLQAQIGASEHQKITFTDSRLNPLFRIADGEKLVITKSDGSKQAFSCHYLPDGQVQVGNTTTTAQAFAKRCQNMGFTFEPEKPGPGDCLVSYEIYQIQDTGSCDYAFMDYDFAKKKMKDTDYCKVYAGVMAASVSLDALFNLHNQDERPMGTQIRSMSISDIVVTKKNGVKTAYYVDYFGFTEIPGLAKRLEKAYSISQQSRSHRHSHEGR